MEFLRLCGNPIGRCPQKWTNSGLGSTRNTMLIYVSAIYFEFPLRFTGFLQHLYYIYTMYNVRLPTFLMNAEAAADCSCTVKLPPCIFVSWYIQWHFQFSYTLIMLLKFPLNCLLTAKFTLSQVYMLYLCSRFLTLFVIHKYLITP